MYDAAPLQVLAHCLFSVTGTTPSFTVTPTSQPKGFSAIRYVSTGIYLLTLDPGLIGNAGEVQPPGNDIREVITIRTPSAGVTTVAIVGAAWTTAGTDGGDTQLQLTFELVGGGVVDPVTSVAAGVEVVVYRGL